MKIFCSNSKGMLDSFSSEFEQSYLETLYRRHRTKMMNANNVYQELIQDKEHVHMNATKWTTLTDFVQYLGKTGKCIVEETERGWYVTYIERDPTILAQKENYQRRVDAEKREEEKLAKRMELQRVEAAKLMDRAGVGLHVEASNMNRSESDKPIALKMVAPPVKKAKKNKSLVFGGDSGDESDEDNKANCEPDTKLSAHASDKKQSSNTTSILPELERKKRKSVLTENNHSKNERSEHPKRKRQQENDDLEDIRKENWIRKDILVRIISKKIANGKYYKRKAIINKVYKKFTAEVEILDSGPDDRDGGDTVEIDQSNLETVVPKEGKQVKILNGRGRGILATLLSADHDKCQGKLELIDDGTIVKKVDFDDFSKAV
jgi:DNA/RNA-binding protein KIN17